MKRLLPALLAASATICAAQTASEPKPPTPGPHKIFVVDKVRSTATAGPGLFGTVQASSGESHSAPTVMTALAKKCPKAVSFTMDPRAAEFALDTNIGGTTLTDQKGDVAYVSPANMPKNMIKDVCKFLESH